MIALRRSYHLLRHGESRANVEGLIVCDPSRGAAEYGLTTAGREQVRRAVGTAREGGTLLAGTRVVSSPFRRAVESAGVAADLLGTAVRIDERLRERGFGAFDLGPDTSYERVWEADLEDPDHRRWGVESVSDVARRMGDLVAELEAEREGSPVLLVTHGDPAAILIAMALGDLSRHRALGALPPAGLRRLGASD